MLHQTFLVFDVVRKFITEMLNHGAHRHGGRVTQCADRASLNVVGEIIEQIQVFQATFSCFDPMNDTVKPSRAFTAGRALAAGFFIVKIG